MRGSSLAATLLLAGALAASCASPTEAIRQRHYAGARDLVVPPAIVSGGGIPAGSLTVVPDYDHVCCWVDLWPRVLAELGRRSGAPSGPEAQPARKRGDGAM
jgi:hypothetical protein